MAIIRSHLVLTRWDLTGVDCPPQELRPECDPSVRDPLSSDRPYYDMFEDDIPLDEDDDQWEGEDFAPNSDEDSDRSAGPGRRVKP